MTLVLQALSSSGLLLLAALAMFLALGVLGALAYGPMQREARLRRQLDGVRQLYGPSAGAGAELGPVAAMGRLLAGIGSLLTRSGLLSPKALASLESTLAVANLRGAHALPMFVGVKVLLLGGLPLLSWIGLRGTDVSPTWMRVHLAIAAIAGLIAPDLLLRSIRTRYIAAVEQAMPDALDLLVICTQAGLALEQGMDRVANEMRATNPACAVELAITHHELRILADRRAALINLGKRTGLVSLQRLAGTLAQALRYGTPLSQALRVLAAELRAEALTRFETRAARLPVLMTLPMILFILPCVFLVVAGPAMLAIIEKLSGQ